MKKLTAIAAAAVFLTSCGAAQSYENSSRTDASFPAETVTSVSETVQPQVTKETVSKETVTSVTSAETAAQTSAAAAAVSDIPEPAELPSECYIDTGTFYQYSCELAGDTACGATAGTLILQSISYVTGDDLTERMNTIRGYSALGDEYSCGAPQYYLAGFQISNSVNRYLEENGFEGYRLTDHRTEKSTEQTLMELISTGRPAVLEVCYGGAAVLEEFRGYSHWICVNAYRTTDSGVEFRYSDTITNSESWVSSELLDRSNANVSYGDFYIQPERYIAAFDKPV